MALAKLSELKSLLDIDDTDSDTLLAVIQRGVQAQFEQFCECQFIYPDADIVEDHDGGCWDLYLKYFPISGVGIVSVKEASDRDFAAATALTVDEDYVVIAERGILTRLPDQLRDWQAGRRTNRVTYRGGYYEPDNGSPPSDVDVVPDDLQHAALLQAVENYNRRQDPGQKAETLAGPGGNMTFQQGLQLLDEVKRIIAPYRRGL